MAERDERAWAAATAPELVAQARAEAMAEVRTRLRERMVAALVDALEEPGEAGTERRRPVAEPAERPSPPAAARRTALWLYGVLDAGVADPDGWVGVDGTSPVRAVRQAGLCALVSDVPLADFGPGTLERALEDLDRVAALSRAHEQVLDRAVGLGTVVPFRLCTIYESPRSVAAMLEQERERLEATLERLHDASEWGVKAYLVGGPRTAQAATAADLASGADYLARKRDDREAAEQARADLDAALERIHATLSEQATDAVLGRPHDRRLAGRDDEMVFNASYLVPDDRLGRFREVVEELGRRHGEAGLDLVMTGPWPPYHFVDEAVTA